MHAVDAAIGEEVQHSDAAMQVTLNSQGACNVKPFQAWGEEEHLIHWSGSENTVIILK